MIYQEKHPYNDCYPIPDETRLLIVGTAPPPRFSIPAPHGKERKELDFEFFYGSEDNYMWPFLDDIAEELDHKRLFSDNMSSKECCKHACEFLRCHKAWMHDVLQEYHRKEGKEWSSDDNDIEPERFTDFRKITSHNSISMIAFTSEQAAKWTFKALDEQKICHIDLNQILSSWKHKAPNAKQRYEHCLLVTELDGHEVKFYLLPTPARRGLNCMDKLMIYKNMFQQLH